MNEMRKGEKMHARCHATVPVICQYLDDGCEGQWRASERRLNAKLVNRPHTRRWPTAQLRTPAVGRSFVEETGRGMVTDPKPWRVDGEDSRR